MASPGLAPPGSSSYSSNTLNVGDGTWDSQRNTFLLPNLVGLNYKTMRYNGRIGLVRRLLLFTDLDRHGQSIPRTPRLSLPNPRSRHCRRHHFPPYCPSGHHDQPLLHPKACQGCTVSHLAANIDTIVDDCYFHTRVLCGGTSKESDESSSRNRLSNICLSAGPILWGLVGK